MIRKASGAGVEGEMGGAIADDVKEAIGGWFMQDLKGHGGTCGFHFECDEKLQEGSESGRQGHNPICVSKGPLLLVFREWIFNELPFWPVVEDPVTVQPGCPT